MNLIICWNCPRIEHVTMAQNWMDNYDMVIRILEKSYTKLMRGFDHGVINGVKIRHRMQGICLIIECQSTIGDYAPVGVTVDIVPVNIESQTKTRFNTNAREFLRHTLHEYSQRGVLYRLISKENTSDTGLIEN